jgi:orotidine-5'-phosphate decarboxylase
MPSFSQQLRTQITHKANPVVVGLDPRWESLPATLRGSIEPRDWAGIANAYTMFCNEVIDVVAPLVPCVKPQAAFFEELGPHGMIALGKVIRHARERGLLVILDGKRNDIGSTATAYAHAYLDNAPQSPWGAQALTVSPYLGEDSLTPFIDVAMKNDCGIFVLVKTSNPGGGMFQDLITDEQSLYQRVAGWVEQQSVHTADDSGYGCCGAVVGATYPEQLDELRRAMPHSWLLIPGYGSQGGTAADVAPGFDEEGFGAVVNNSRGIIFAYASKAYSQKYGEARWLSAVEAATCDMIEQLREHTYVGRIG